MRIHWPSLITGLFAMLSLFAFLGADRPQGGYAVPGRFELEATTNHVFVLDRYTGKVWQKFVTDGSGQSDQDFALPKIK